MKRTCNKTETKLIMAQKENIVFQSLQGINLRSFLKRNDLYVSGATIRSIPSWEKEDSVRICCGNYSIGVVGYILDDFNDVDGNPYLVKHPMGNTEVKVGERLIIITSASDYSFLMIRPNQLFSEVFADIVAERNIPDDLVCVNIIPHPFALEFGKNEVVFVNYAERILTVYSDSTKMYRVEDYEKPKLKSRFTYANVIHMQDNGKRRYFEFAGVK